VDKYVKKTIIAHNFVKELDLTYFDALSAKLLPPASQQSILGHHHQAAAISHLK
jgi:hypothetical protein